MDIHSQRAGGKESYIFTSVHSKKHKELNTFSGWGRGLGMGGLKAIGLKGIV